MELDYNNLELFHSGVRGMKWHRHLFGKWQKQATYANGTSDPNGGKSRKHNPVAKDSKSSKKGKNATEKKMTKEQIRKKCLEGDDPAFILANKHLLTTNELGEITRRMQSTQQIRNMTPKTESKAKKVMKTAGKVVAATTATTAALKRLGIVDVDKILGEKIKDVATDLKKGQTVGTTQASRKRDKAYKDTAKKTWDINELDKLRNFLSEEEYAKRLKTILLRNKTMGTG